MCKHESDNGIPYMVQGIKGKSPSAETSLWDSGSLHCENSNTSGA